MAFVYWKNRAPSDMLSSALELFGEPTTLSVKRDGLAMWVKSDLKDRKIFCLSNCFDEIILRDEPDFFYTSVKIPVLPDKLQSVLSLQPESISYDFGKHLLTVRSSKGLAANIAMLKLATDIALNKRVKLYDLQSDREYTYKGIREIRKKRILERLLKITAAANDEDVLKQLYKSLCKNIRSLRIHS